MNTLICNITHILKYYYIILFLYDIILLLLFHITIHAIEMLIYNKNITGPYSEATLYDKLWQYTSHRFRL